MLWAGGFDICRILLYARTGNRRSFLRLFRALVKYERLPYAYKYCGIWINVVISAYLGSSMLIMEIHFYGLNKFWQRGERFSSILLIEDVKYPTCEAID